MKLSCSPLRSGLGWRLHYTLRLAGWSHGDAMLDTEALQAWLLAALERQGRDHACLAAVVPLLQLCVLARPHCMLCAVLQWLLSTKLYPSAACVAQYTQASSCRFALTAQNGYMLNDERWPFCDCTRHVPCTAEPPCLLQDAAVTQQSAQQLMLALTGRLSRAEQAGEASAALLRKVRPPSSQCTCTEPTT